MKSAKLVQTAPATHSPVRPAGVIVTESGQGVEGVLRHAPFELEQAGIVGTGVGRAREAEARIARRFDGLLRRIGSDLGTC